MVPDWNYNVNKLKAGSHTIISARSSRQGKLLKAQPLQLLNPLADAAGFRLEYGMSRGECRSKPDLSAQWEMREPTSQG